MGGQRSRSPARLNWQMVRSRGGNSFIARLTRCLDALWLYLADTFLHLQNVNMASSVCLSSTGRYGAGRSN